ncbi:MAG: CHAT domain-containing protein, partial [Anaerolineae bacterium]
MPDSLPELRIEIHKLGNRYLAAVRKPDGQEVLTNEFQHDPTGLTYLGPLWLVERSKLGPDERHRIGSSLKSRTSKAEVAAHGWRLYHYLFGDGEDWHQFLTSHPEYTRCHLILRLSSDAASLWRLPWEYIYDGREFPCLSGQMLISRTPEGLSALSTEVTKRPLRILLVIAQPDGQPPFDSGRELGVVQDALGDAIASGMVEMDVLPEATATALLEAVQQKTYHVIHYVGHGIYSLKEHQGFLCLESEIGRTELASGMQLRRFLRGWAGGLFVISASQSAQIGVLDAFDHVAIELLRQDVPAVLSVPTSLDEKSTMALYRALYTSLSDGRSTIMSLHQSRLALKHQDEQAPTGQRRFNWGVPALYQRAPEQRLVEPSPPE